MSSQVKRSKAKRSEAKPAHLLALKVDILELDDLVARTQATVAAASSGVGIAIHKSLWKYIKNVEPRGGRLIKCTMKFENNLDIIGAYAPPACTSKNGRPVDTDPTIKDEFYDARSRSWDNNPKINNMILLGDMNAKVIQFQHEEEKQS